MPQLLPLAIKGGIALGGSLLGSKVAGGTPKGDQQILDQQRQISQRALGMSNELFPQGTQLMQLAGRSFNPVVDYWSRILSGDRGAALSGLAPEINQLNEGYDASRRAASELMPRGGGRATLLQNLPYQQNRDVSSILQLARPQAAGQLLAAGQGISNAGSGLIQNSINALYGSTSAGRDILNYSAQKREADRALGTSLGKSLFELVKNIPINIGKKGGGILTSGGGWDAETGNA